MLQQYSTQTYRSEVEDWIHVLSYDGSSSIPGPVCYFSLTIMTMVILQNSKVTKNLFWVQPARDFVAKNVAEIHIYLQQKKNPFNKLKWYKNYLK